MKSYKAFTLISKSLESCRSVELLLAGKSAYLVVNLKKKSAFFLGRISCVKPANIHFSKAVNLSGKYYY